MVHFRKFRLHHRIYTRISFHYEYASAVTIGLIFVGVKQCDCQLSIFKVRIKRVISVRKSGRVEELNILLTDLGSYVGFSITSGDT